MTQPTVPSTFRERQDAAGDFSPNFIEKLKKICRCDNEKYYEKPPDRLSDNRSRRTKLQLARIGATACGFELCYAANEAFVTPILLNLGLPVYLTTLVWCLPPIVGFFLGPILGTLSDDCRLRWGRRRPFIVLYSLGILIGLILVPQGAWFGVLLGDAASSMGFDPLIPRGSSGRNHTSLLDEAFENSSSAAPSGPNPISARPWGTALTILGVVLLDFCCDCCWNPTRAYLLDVTSPEQHQEGISMFAILAGVGGGVGYAAGGVDWQSIGFDISNGRAGATLGAEVFLLVFCIYVVCLMATVTAAKETPLEEIGGGGDEEAMPLLKQTMEMTPEKTEAKTGVDSEEKTNPDDPLDKSLEFDYGSVGGFNGELDDGNVPLSKTLFIQKSEMESQTGAANGDAIDDVDAKAKPEDSLSSTPMKNLTLKSRLLSMVQLPRSLLVLCLTHLFSWMSLVTYCLYFTDFVGQSVFGGDPKAPPFTSARIAYESGVRTGSLGMALFAIVCAIYSSQLEGLIKRFGARPLYVGAQLIYATGSGVMALLPYTPVVFLFSPAAGIMYATLLALPFIIIANYHSLGVFEEGATPGDMSAPERGVGTDLALLTSMMFLAQFFLSAFMGVAVHLTGTTRTVMGTAAVCGAAAAIAASRVLYLDL